MDIPLQLLFIDAWTQFDRILLHMEANTKKRIKFPDGGIIARSKDGYVIIPAERAGTHITMYRKTDGGFNVHKTSEKDTPKKRIPIFDVKGEDKKTIEEKYRQEVSKLDLKIDIKDQRFKDSFVMAKLASFQPAFEALFQTDGDEVKFLEGISDADLSEVLEKHVIIAKLEDINGIEFQKAWLCTDNGTVWGRLWKKDGAYYLCTDEQAMNLLKNSGMQALVDRVKG